MSYILDALRRADAERSRGAVPGLHDQNAPADTEPAARDHRPLIWAAAGAGALLVAVVVVLVVAPWRASAPGPVAIAPPPQLNAGPTPADASIPPTGAPPATAPGALAPAAVPVEPPINHVTAPVVAPTPTPTPAPVAPTTPAPVPTIAPATIPPRLADRAAQGRVGVLESRADAARNTSAANAANANAPAVEHYGPPVTSAAAAPAPARVAAIPNIADLPPDVRATLPRLVPGGAMDSTTPADRMLILNGQVFHEGDKPAPDTVLEQIHLKSAVLDFRGQRYVITY